MSFQGLKLSMSPHFTQSKSQSLRISLLDPTWAELHHTSLASSPPALPRLTPYPSPWPPCHPSITPSMLSPQGLWTSSGSFCGKALSPASSLTYSPLSNLHSHAVPQWSRPDHPFARAIPLQSFASPSTCSSFLSPITYHLLTCSVIFLNGLRLLFMVCLSPL